MQQCFKHFCELKENMAVAFLLFVFCDIVSSFLNIEAYDLHYLLESYRYLPMCLRAYVPMCLQHMWSIVFMPLTLL